MPSKYFLILFLILGLNVYAQQYELQSIEFRGNEEISSSILSDVIYSQETPGWFWQFLNSFTPFGAEPVYFDSSDIERDMAALQSFYKANGFFNAQFSYGYDIDTSAREVELFYNITENDFAKYGKINFIGLDSLPYGVYEDLETDLSLDSSGRYIETEVQQNIDNFVNIMLNSGFPFARFDSSIVIVDTTEGYADINIFFTTGILYSLDTVIVKLDGPGADEVTDPDVRDITGLEKGEPYSLEEIRIAQRRLSRTGLFNSINISAIDSAVHDDRIPLLLEGRIGLMNELSPEIILNNEQHALNVGSGAAYVRKNFFGGSRRFTARFSFGLQDFFNVDFGNLIRRFSFRDTTLLGYVDSRMIIEQPYLFHEPIHGILENYLTIEKQRNFNITRFGSKITFDFELPHYTFVNSFSTFYNIEQTNEVIRTNRDSLSKKLLSVIGFDIGKTTSDNYLFPTEGYNITLQLEEANSLPYLFSKIVNSTYNGALFYRILLSSAYYLALDQQRDVIFGLKFKSGHLQAYYGDYGGLPINRTFYAGGSNSVRGWRSNDLRPQGTPQVENFHGVNYKGGTFLLEGSAELRYRFLDNFGSAIFFDYGNVWLNYTDFRYDEVALAAGFGLRYYTQVAPFRIDFGFKLYDPFDKKFLWDNWKPGIFNNLEFHFGIGEAF